MIEGCIAGIVVGKFLSIIVNDRGEPAEVWEITSWSWKTAGKLPLILEEFIEYTPIL